MQFYFDCNIFYSASSVFAKKTRRKTALHNIFNNVYRALVELYLQVFMLDRYVSVGVNRDKRTAYHILVVIKLSRRLKSV